MESKKNNAKCKELIKRIINKMELKIIKIYLKKWKNYLNNKEEIIHDKIDVNNNNKYKKKLISLLNKYLILLKYRIKAFALENKKS